MARERSVVTSAIVELLSEFGVFLNIRGNSDELLSSSVLVYDSGLHIEENVGLYAGGELPNIGSFSYSQSALPAGMSIGRYCSIGAGLRIERGQAPIERFTTSNFTYERGGPVFQRAVASMGLGPSGQVRPRWGRLPVIQHDVWIGSDVQLARDIVIGTGSVVLEGSAVRSSVAPYTIVAGNPARVVQLRFDSLTAARLLRSKWWELDPLLLASVRTAEPKDLLTVVSSHGDDESRYRPRVLTASHVASAR